MANLLLIVFINFVGIGALIPILPFTVIDGLGHSEIVMTALLAALLLPCLLPPCSGAAVGPVRAASCAIVLFVCRHSGTFLVCADK